MMVDHLRAMTQLTGPATQRLLNVDTAELQGDDITIARWSSEHGMIPFGLKDARLAESYARTNCPQCGGPRKYIRCDYCGSANE